MIYSETFYACYAALQDEEDWVETSFQTLQWREEETITRVCSDRFKLVCVLLPVTVQSCVSVQMSVT